MSSYNLLTELRMNDRLVPYQIILKLVCSKEPRRERFWPNYEKLIWYGENWSTQSRKTPRKQVSQDFQTRTKFKEVSTMFFALRFDVESPYARLLSQRVFRYHKPHMNVSLLWEKRTELWSLTRRLSEAMRNWYLFRIGFRRPSFTGTFRAQ